MPITKMEYKYCPLCEKQVHYTQWAHAQRYCKKCMKGERPIGDSYSENDPPTCCGKVVPSMQMGGNGQPLYKSRQIFMCCNCGKQLGYVSEDVFPEEIMKAKYRDKGEKWLQL